MQAATIRVIVSPEVSYDLDRMQGLTRELLDRLGCGGCHSGRHILFTEEAEFIFSKAGVASIHEGEFSA